MAGPGPLDLGGGDKPKDTTTTTTTTQDKPTTTNTTSSGDSSGGSSAPANPFPDAHDFELRQFQTFASAYSQLWGEQPHPGYIAAAVKQGLNMEEFLENERYKPAFLKSEAARDKGSSFADLLHQMGVTAGAFGGGRGGGNRQGGGGKGQNDKRRLPSGGPKG